ncbi:MAG: HNH endonuclease signature motif containing protein [Pseudonocardia sp.]
MQEAQRVPVGLAVMPPGPELAAVLAGVDLDQAVAGDAVELLRASARQLAHDQARFFAVMVQVGRAVAAEARSSVPASWRGPVIGEWAGAEIGAVLTWTTAKADRELGVAEELVCRLPLVFAELAAGRIDQGRAWTFVDVLRDAELTEAQIEHICAALVPLASGLTSGQIRARLLKLIIGVDPGYAARRYRRTVRERGVHGYLGKDGTATITATGLSTDEAVAACERIEHLAGAVKAAGHPGTLTQIQADLFTRLLDGRLDGMGPGEMVAAMLADAVADAEAEADAETNAVVVVARVAAAAQPDAAAVPVTADVPAFEVPAAEVPAVEVSADDVAAEAAESAESAESPESVASSETTESSETAELTEVAELAEASASTDAARSAGDLESAAASDEPAASENGVAPEVRAPQPRRGGEVRVGLATLMHRDEWPGEVPGWGPVLADVARAMAGRQHRSEWRFAVTDADGYLVLAGITRRRPRDAGDGARECDGGVVEIHVPVALLVELAAASEPCGVWASVVADIAGQYARRHRLQRVLDARPNDRFACAVLRRHVQVRDRTCVAPGCRRPARSCDQDHTLDHELGGLTVAGNTGPLCRRHHRMKHEGRWRLEQPRPGRFCWTSPLGRVYRTRGEPIDPPLPEPAPRGPEESTDLDEPDSRIRFEGSQPILWRPPPAPPAPPPPPSRPQCPEDDKPPF